MKHNLTCTHKNITLRPLLAADIELLRKWRNDAKYTQYLSPIPYITEEAQRVWYEKYLSEKDCYTWAVIDTNSTNRIVGSVSLYNFVENSCEYGRILIDPEKTNRGIGTKAEHLALHIGFDTLDTQRIHTYINVANIAAIRKSEKNGFVKTSESEHNKTAKNYVNHIHMVIEKEDFIHLD